MSEVKKYLSEIFIKNSEAISDFFSQKYTLTKPLFYSSVDIRHSGYKIVPVDTNLFPAGFNLLSDLQAASASKQVEDYLKKHHPNKKNKIVIIAEENDRNKFYLQNLKSLLKIIANTNCDVRLARLDLKSPSNFETADGSEITIYPLSRSEDNKLKIDESFIPDLIIINNDFSSGSPEILKGLTQPIFPPVGMGWYRRRKTSHFDTYEIICREFCRKFEIDLFKITALFTKCGKINFKSKEGLDCVAENVNEILRRLNAKYREHKIETPPYVFVKANSGTYGMGIMVVKSAKDIIEINKKSRHSMNVIKEGVENTEVVIQEGIPTIDKYNEYPSEPMVYMVNGNVISCNHRVNINQDEMGNLNSKGMQFVNYDCVEESGNKICNVESVVARLASLAASQECYEVNWQI